MRAPIGHLNDGGGGAETQASGPGGQRGGGGLKGRRSTQLLAFGPEAGGLSLKLCHCLSGLIDVVSRDSPQDHFCEAEVKTNARAVCRQASRQASRQTGGCAEQATETRAQMDKGSWLASDQLELVVKPRRPIQFQFFRRPFRPILTMLTASRLSQAPQPLFSERGMFCELRVHVSKCLVL